MKKFMLKTMGCKSNQLEGSLIEENLIKVGFEKVDKVADANIFILNSCTVTHKSDNEAFSILNKAKHDNPEVKTILTGCIAQIEKENLLQNPNIDLVLGNDEKLKISSFIDFSEKCFTEDIMDLDTFHDVFLENTKKTRASLKIQDGCDNRCSYCIIPFARGKNRSANADFILEQIKIYENMGFNEIVLTGIHIGQWGIDFSDRKNLLHLLENIESKTNIARFRLGSLNPLEINDEMLNFLKNSEKFCPHFHLSLQSMCDKTLKSMNRHYSVNQSLELIEKISGSFNLPFIGSDVIAGFSGESEEDFNTTVENLNKSKLTQIHTFPYSVRKNTAAESFDNPVDLKTKNKRASIIKQISAQKHAEFLQNNVSSIQEVLIEKNVDKATGLLKGVTRNYINVLIEQSEDFSEIKNTLQKVSITNIEEKVFARIV
jgi:threonylcarbamoyladenosine tRNA methylthiotransferase MtaB